MKNKITLLVLAVFVVLIGSTVGIRKMVQKKNRKGRLQKLHPALISIIFFSDLTKLHLAALDNDAERTEEFIGQGWAVDRRVKGRLTPLHVASMCACDESATVLIEHGADLNGQSTDGLTPLAFAAVGAKPQMVRFLLAAGADPFLKNKDDRTPARAARQWRREMMRPRSSYDKIYGEKIDACIEILNQAEKDSAKGLSFSD